MPDQRSRAEVSEARCDECGKLVVKPYRLPRFQGRMPEVCGACLEKIVRGVAQADRAVRQRTA